jgi:hypothetical protein
MENNGKIPAEEMKFLTSVEECIWLDKSKDEDVRKELPVNE